MSFIARLIGLFLFAVGMLMLVGDGIRSIAAGALVTTPLGASWRAVDAGSLAAAVGWLEGRSPVLAAWLAGPVTAVPTLLVATALGVALMIAGRRRGRRRRPIL